MGNQFRHWCPGGCGKSVYYARYSSLNDKKRFKCHRCEKCFSKEELLEAYLL